MDVRLQLWAECIVRKIGLSLQGYLLDQFRNDEWNDHHDDNGGSCQAHDKDIGRTGDQ